MPVLFNVHYCAVVSSPGHPFDPSGTRVPNAQAHVHDDVRSSIAATLPTPAVYCRLLLSNRRLAISATCTWYRGPRR